MAANVRAKSAGYGLNEILPSAHATIIDKNAAESVNRNSTLTGWRRVPLAFVGTSNTTAAAIPDTAHDRGSYMLGGVLYFDTYRKEDFFSLPMLPVGHTLQAVRVYFRPDSGHGGQPDLLPKMELYRRYTTSTLVGDDEYPSAGFDLPTYETAGGWYLEVGSIGQVIGALEDYVVGIVGEGLTNAKTIEVWQVLVYMTIDHAEGGADLSFWA